MAIYASKGDRLNDVTIYPEAIKGISRRGGRVSGAGRNLSSFWQDCPVGAIRTDPGMGCIVEDSFVDLGLSGAITNIISSAGMGRYLVFGGATATITPDEELGGGMVLTLTDNNQPVSITTKQTPFQITSGAGTLWFEARIKISSIVINEQSFFVGLMDATAQDATHPLSAAGALADQNLVGFHFPELNTTAFDTSYKADLVAAVEVNSNVGTLVEGTYVRLGMRFDTSNNVLSFYIDGVSQATCKIIPDATGDDFPADVTLAPVVACMTAVDTTETLTMDWWKIAQLR